MVAGWQDGLTALLWTYLEDGPPKRGSLREAIDLIGGSRSLGVQLNTARSSSGSRPNLSPNPLSEDADGDDIPFPFGKASPLSTDASEDDENGLISTTVHFDALQLEKLRRNLTRWRLDFHIEDTQDIRVALVRILKGIPELYDILEPLADFWSVRLAGKEAAIYDDQLLNSWTGELIGNLVCLYVGTQHGRDLGELERMLEYVSSEVKRWAQVSGQGAKRDEMVKETWFQLENAIFSFSNLVSEMDEACLIAALKHLCTDARMTSGCALFFLKPVLRRKEAVEQANRLISGKEESENLIHLISKEETRGKAKDKRLAGIVLSYVMNRNKGIQHVIQKEPHLSSSILRANIAQVVCSALSQGEEGDSQGLKRHHQSLSKQQSVEDQVHSVFEQLNQLEASGARMLHALTHILLELEESKVEEK